MTSPADDSLKESFTTNQTKITCEPMPEKKRRGRKRKIPVIDFITPKLEEENIKNDEITRSEEKMIEEKKDEEKVDEEGIEELMKDDTHFLNDEDGLNSLTNEDTNEKAENTVESKEEAPRKKRKYKKRKSKEKEIEKKHKKFRRIKKEEENEKENILGTIWIISSANPYFESKTSKSEFNLCLWGNVLKNGREERIFFVQYNSLVSKSQVETDFLGCKVNKSTQDLVESFKEFCSEERIGDLEGNGKGLTKFIERIRQSDGFDWDQSDFFKIKGKEESSTHVSRNFHRNPNFSKLKFYFFMGRQDMSLPELAYRIYEEKNVYRRNNKSAWNGYFSQECLVFEYFSTEEFIKTLNDIYLSPNFCHIEGIFVFGYEDIISKLDRESLFLNAHFDKEIIKRNTEEIYELDWSSDAMSVEITCLKKVRPEMSLEIPLASFLDQVLVCKTISSAILGITNTKKKMKGKKIILPLNVKDFCTGLFIKLKDAGYSTEEATDIVKGTCASKHLDYDIHHEEEEIRKLEDLLYN